MTALVSDEMVESIAIVGRRDEIADRIRAKVAGIADTVSLECTRRPDPLHFADICRALKTGG
jgi:alkanesulfonate monooxygenase SsuD/methylene tetrahydromethanopterin reductase-like flavin-dependent oxidoreductase (luciferase family)